MPDYCLNCETRLEGRWCHACGQTRLRAEDRTVKSVLGEFLKQLTDLDGRLLRSFGLLVFRPGFLAAEYFRGRRVRYLSPVALFLLANVAYFFAPSLTDFSPSLLGHMKVQPYSELAAHMVERPLETRELTIETYTVTFEQRQNDIAKTLLFLHVPLLALGLALLHKRRWLFADHLLVGFWMMAFILLHSLVTPRLLGLLVTPEWSQAALNWTLRIGLLGTLAAWTGFLLRGAYLQPGWLAALKVPVLFAVIFAAHLVYRLLLFGVVFAMT